MVALKEKIYICDVRDQWSELKNKIKNNVSAYVLEAALALRSSNTFLSNSDALP